MPESIQDVELRRDFSEFKENEFAQLSSRVDVIGTRQEDCQVMQTERYADTKADIKVIKTQNWLMIITLVTGLVTLVVALAVKAL